MKMMIEMIISNIYTCYFVQNTNSVINQEPVHRNKNRKTK